MNMYEIITKKKRKEELNEAEIRFLVKGYTDGEIPDYQVSSLLMAICLNGMSKEETALLTLAIAESGDTVDLSAFGDVSVDKHSTGGVGDKTTLIVAPLAASLGCKVAKMSGRGLGHTGGTIDKLEAIPGYSAFLSPDSFSSQVKKIGIAVVGQTGNLAPADKKLYALRDVTATVDSLPLIASSVMGKKLAAGSKSIVLDVKCGSGSFMKSAEDARTLAEIMVEIGRRNGRRVSAVITDMDMPLGHTVGNSLEVMEAIEVLSGKGDSDITELSLTLASEMVHLSLGIDRDTAMEDCRRSLFEGAALGKFKEWLSSQGADVSFIDEGRRLPVSALYDEAFATSDGYIAKMDTEKIGLASVALGAGRTKKEDEIDYGAGIILLKKTGDEVKKGEAIARLYSSSKEKLATGKALFENSISYSHKSPAHQRTVIDTVGGI